MGAKQAFKSAKSKQLENTLCLFYTFAVVKKWLWIQCIIFSAYYLENHSTVKYVLL